MQIDGAGLTDLVESWNRRPSDPLISEHSRLSAADGEARIFRSPDREAVATVSPTSLQGVGLVEVAAENPSLATAFWAEIREEVMARAKADGYRKLEVVDRGSVLDLSDASEGRSTMRLVLREPEAFPADAVEHYKPEVASRVVEILQESFADHPENGNWELSDLYRRTNNPSFDPRCFLVRRSGATISGFCWTKLHPDNVGEIYLIAVAVEARGRGAGRELLREGIRHLVEEHSCHEILVYTDAKNVAAIRLYQQEGFVTDRVDRRLEIFL